jgi:hypothetical protein
MLSEDHEARIAQLERTVVMLIENQMEIFRLLNLNSAAEPDKITFMIILRDEFNSLMKFVYSTFGDEPTRKKNLEALENRKAEWDKAVAPFFARIAVPPLPHGLTDDSASAA